MSKTEKRIRAIGKISTKSSKSGYDSYWLYLPSKLINNRELPFPFHDKEKVDIELTEEGKIIVSKHNTLRDLINEYGLENASLAKVLENKAIENKKRPFLYFKEDMYSFQDTNLKSNRIAHGIIKLLESIGLRKVNQKLTRTVKICAMLPNCPNFIFTWFATSKSRCTFIPLDINLKGDLLTEMLNELEADFFIIDYKFFNTFKQSYKNPSLFKKIILHNSPKDFKFDSNIIPFEEIESNIEENPGIEVKGRHEMEILYTSGTTGKPKGLLFRNYYVLTGSNMGKEMEKVGLKEKSIIYCPLPLFHALAHLLVIFPALFYNASVVLAEKFDVLTFWEEVERYNVTGVIYFGNLLQQLINQPPTRNDRQHPIEWAFGFGISKDTWESFENRFAIPIYEGWTLTEAVGITVNKAGSKGGKNGSVGKPVSGYDIKIVDELGNKLPPGINNIGEIVARSTIPIPLEYYNIKGVKTTPQESWFNTGDYGYRDQDGFYYYVGRKSDLIHSQGERFFASEIEHFVNSHPYILESAAFGVTNSKELDEEIKLCVVLKKAGSLNVEELYDYINMNLASFMVPRYIEFKEELPKTSTNFIQKFLLKKEWKDRISQANTWDARKNLLKKMK
ncbi:MAG: hypothetical protein EU533_04090 [Promethearchaeota archaeon]|nr:MAG: hypothetical protein EU533_04090 [Candidatus Lokiarchaeota archaeon]